MSEPVAYLYWWNPGDHTHRYFTFCPSCFTKAWKNSLNIWPIYEENVKEFGLECHNGPCPNPCFRPMAGFPVFIDKRYVLEDVQGFDTPAQILRGQL